jgi:purine-binding chemotaxis protein CheW
MDSSTSSSDVVCLVWRCAGRVGAVPVRHVAEVLRPLPVERFAEAPPGVSGLCVVRGRPIPIIDAGLLVSGSPGSPTRFVIVAIDERRSVGLAVDAVLGVRQLDQGLLFGLPPLLREREGTGIERLATLDGELLVILETARLVPESVWTGIEGSDA